MSANSTPSPLTLLRVVGLAACLALALQQIAILWPIGDAGLAHMRERLPLLTGPAIGLPGAMAAYGLGFAAFGWALWRASAVGARAPGATAKAGLVVLQIALALLTNDKLLLLTAAELALLFPPRAAWLGLGGQVLALLLACAWQLQRLPAKELMCNVSGSNVQAPPLEQRSWLLWQDAVVGGGFQLLTFGIGCLGAAERRRRAQLEATRASLLAARQLLAGAAGNRERVRVARELHDGIGHHLSALNLQLELLLRRGAGEADAPLRAAQQAARQMLAEVRTLVGMERRQQQAPLAEALRLLCAGVRPQAELVLEPMPALADDAAWRAFSAARQALERAGGRSCRLWLRGQGEGGAELRLSMSGEGEWTTVWQEAAR
ncbi:histidine kinase [Chromobacterium subtsugae]|uniref:histidine kinase n=1 Tax=Chromobacterium subtsugae TaxID=251747 RepID=A0ABS7FA28_9NEIS|nr:MULTISPECIES: histidine kinase [Chromobacterium]MBW7565257.1 histidine kinase [Chromobacterium subtsugae]MBW8286892.1 histidine kinase [Chromobacterium subtsugae]WSE90634.1 histidine kinase [Chromobacterium subtsugae]WVH59007.1 histidine kinase [Chromobacterium subtsugae]